MNCILMLCILKKLQLHHREENVYMKQKYEAPTMETIVFNIEDVVTMSYGGDGDGGSTPWLTTELTTEGF